MADKRALSGLFGGDDEYDNNVIRGLLGMAAGAFSPQANTAGQALGLGIQSGLGAVDQGRQMTAQAAMQALQKAKLTQELQQQKKWQEMFSGTVGNGQQATGPVASVPPEMRPYLGMMGPEKGAAAAANYIGQNARAYKERELPMSDGTFQKQVSQDNGRTWTNLGSSFDKRDPFVLQQVWNEETNAMDTIAVPRAQVSAAIGGHGGSGGKGDRVVVSRGKPEQMTDAQSAAALYADRARSSDEILEKVEIQGKNYAGRALEKAPLGLGNYFQDPDYQKFEQARRDFINAILRRESGAVINAEEFVNAEKQYFPAPGDSEEVIKQKRENRRIAIEGLSRSAGRTYKPKSVSGVKSKTPTLPPGFEEIR